MSASRAVLNSEVDRERSRRIERLRQLSRTELLKLPAQKKEDCEVLDTRVTFTTYIESQTDGRLLVLVRSDRRRFFGLFSSGGTYGFWALPNGALADVTDVEVMDFFA